MSNQREEYVARINKVIDHIQTHMDRPMTLEALARVANFSPFHFHRIFGSIVGETLGQFIQRIRIEKAAAMLISNPKKTITEVALDCGFSGSAAFARAFKEAYGMTASDWRKGGSRHFRKIRKTDGKIGQTVHKNGKDGISFFGYIESAQSLDRIEQTKRRIPMKSMKNIKVDVKDFPEMTVAYVRHIGPYKGDEKLFQGLWKKLMKWAGPRDLLSRDDVRCLAVYHDDPEITDENKLRISVCVTVPKDTKVEGETGKMTIPAGRYAAAHFEIAADEYQQAWDYVFGQWLPDSGYQCDDRPCFEMYLNDPEQHPERKHIVDICVPVRPL